MGRNDIRAQMLDYVISSFYPEIQAAHAEDRTQRNAAFFREVGGLRTGAAGVPPAGATRSAWWMDRGSLFMSLPFWVPPLSQSLSPRMGVEQDRLLGNAVRRARVLGHAQGSLCLSAAGGAVCPC